MRFIHVGVGGFGQHWANILKQTPEVELVGLVDISDTALQATCDKHGYSPGICFHDLKKAIRKTKPEAVVSSTPPVRHKVDVITALRAGLNVISEKPMADTLSHCKAMLKVARETGKLYVVSQNYRYAPVTWTMANIIKSGKLGKIGQIKVEFYMGVDFGGGFRHDMEFPVIVDMSIHHFDLMRFITGLDAVKVKASSWNPFWSNYKGDCSSTALFEMNNGVRLLYNASWCAKGAYCSWDGNWQIECENGTLQMVNGQIKIIWTKGLYAVDHEEVVTPEEIPVRGQQYVLNEFIKAAREGGHPATEVTDNIKSVSMVFATVKAMQTGKAVPVLNKDIA